MQFGPERTGWVTSRFSRIQRRVQKISLGYTGRRMFLSYLDYSIMAMIESWSRFTYQQTGNIVSCAKELVYINRSHSVLS